MNQENSDNYTRSRNPSTVPDNSDPLGINKLSVDYDYLLYKINDYVHSVQLQINDICKQETEIINDQIINGIIDKNIKEFKGLIQKCDELENFFEMMDQIATISETFKTRLNQIVIDYKDFKEN